MKTSGFGKQDKEFMSLALKEAERALDMGDYPVGAVLTVNDEFVDQARNSILTDAQTTAHAEQKLLRSNSAQLRRLIRENKAQDICLYTTLEPCLMCLGVAVLHRVRRIVIASPDPHGGATKINPNEMGSFYAAYWPRIEAGLMKEEAADLIIEFLKTEKLVSWRKMLDSFLKMKQSWQEMLESRPTQHKP
jgi:tRNA(adenine34) deaminase